MSPQVLAGPRRKLDHPYGFSCFWISKLPAPRALTHLQDAALQVQNKGVTARFTVQLESNWSQLYRTNWTRELFPASQEGSYDAGIAATMENSQYDEGLFFWRVSN